ncbi:MAG: SoxR reducing system RseC family protein [Candidatus Marinimicrobia bacterium]|nr:SoxR reducing system RseC family protein [Candidatus Neomarinimicrobiota bacterium]
MISEKNNKELALTCDKCGAKILCLGSDSKKELTLSDKIKTNKLLEITKDDNFLLQLSFYQYGLPLLGFLTGIITCYTINPALNEFIIFLSGLLALGLASLLSTTFISRMAKKYECLLSSFKI